MNKTLSVGLAGGLGSIIGALVGIDLLSGIMPYGTAGILGMAVGGCVGYVVIDFRELCAGVKRAWTLTIEWRPDWYLLPAWVSGLPAAVMVTLTGVICMDLFAATLCLADPRRSVRYFWEPRALDDPVLHYVLPILFFLVALAVVVGLASDERAKRKSGRHFLAYFATQALRWTFLLSPVGAPLFVIWWIAIRVPGFFRMLRAVAAAIRQFAAYVFIEVHSQRRMICSVDAAIGAGVGFYFGSAFIGGIVGAVLGMVNYEVVSIRWLKLSPR